MLGCLSYYFLTGLHSLRIPKKMTVNSMFTLYKVIVTKVDLMDGDTNLKTYNLKKKNKNNGNDKGNQQLINLNCNFLKFKLIFFFRVWESPNS